MRSLLNGMAVRHKVSHGKGEFGGTVVVGPVQATFALRGGANRGTRLSSPGAKPAESVLPAARPKSRPEPELSVPADDDYWIEDGQKYCAQW